MLRPMQKSIALSLLVLAVVGCGNDNPGSGDDAPPIDAPTTTPDSPPIPEGYTRLIGRTWTVPTGQGGQDVYKCVRVTVPQDMYVTNIMAQAPNGTHHTVLSIMAGDDGEQDCNVSTGTIGTVMLYASGVGTSPLDFPAGVGIKIAAGTKIHLNLHLYNATDSTIVGDSAILVKAQSTPPPTLAEIVFAGKLNFSIPASNPPQEHVIQGGCMASSPYTLFAVWPHMHQIAKHQRVELIRGGNTTVLHDLPYQFAEQKYYLKSPEVQVQTGDRINVKCTYFNNTGSNVGSGDSSNEEMCFSGLYKYPASGAGIFQCSSF